MEDEEKDLWVVQNCARKGAAAATYDRQRISDAIELTVQKWEMVLVRRIEIGNLAAWAFTVGQNAAKRLGGDRQQAVASDLSVERELVADEFVPAEVASRMRKLLDDALEGQVGGLTPKMLSLVRKIREPGMTWHRAARELGADRTSLKRMLARAILRLRNLG